MSLGERITLLREEQELSIKELSLLLDIGYQSLYKYEANERTPSIDTITDICDYFNVSIDYLVGRTSIRIINNALSNNYVDLHGLDEYEKECVNFIVSKMLNNSCK